MYYQNESDETLVMLTLAGEQYAYEVSFRLYDFMLVFKLCNKLNINIGYEGTNCSPNKFVIVSNVLFIEASTFSICMPFLSTPNLIHFSMRQFLL